MGLDRHDECPGERPTLNLGGDTGGGEAQEPMEGNTGQCSQQRSKRFRSQKTRLLTRQPC